MPELSPGQFDSGPGSSPEASQSLRKEFSVAALKERAIRFALFLCALLSIATTLGIIFVLVTESLFSVSGEAAFFQFDEVSFQGFFGDTTWSPQYEGSFHYGIWPLIVGTILVAAIAALVGLPIGLASALYLSEYASPRKRNIIKPIIEILAGIPTIVYGYFAIVLITPYILRPIFQDMLGITVEAQNAASAGIVVGIMIIPMVSSLSEDTLRAVPQSLREAGYALGSTKIDVSTRIILPAASSGIVASFLLAIARAIGETMAVTIAAGANPRMTLNPFTGVETMTAFIATQGFGDNDYGGVAFKSLYAVGLTLFTMTLAMNIISQAVMRRFREVYQ